MVITHAHEDHLGAVAHLWRQLRCPIYATPFAAAVLRRKLGEAQLVNEAKITVIKPGGRFELGAVRPAIHAVSHSVPEAQALVIRTPYGTIVHTGDFKLDPNPLVGPPTDEDAFRALGRRGCAGHGLRQHQCHGGGAFRVRGGCADQPVRPDPADQGRVAVTCFASNVARVESVAFAARDAGRSVALVGRSLRNLETAAAIAATSGPSRSSCRRKRPPPCRTTTS